MFLDSSPVIYLIERHSIFGPRVVQWLAANATTLVTSEIIRVESLIIPMRVHDAARIQDFEVFFATRIDELIPCERTVFDRAIDIRASFGFKLIDSIQLAVTVESHCDTFLTNDHRLTKYTGVRVEVA